MILSVDEDLEGEDPFYLDLVPSVVEDGLGRIWDEGTIYVDTESGRLIRYTGLYLMENAITGEQKCQSELTAEELTKEVVTWYQRTLWAPITMQREEVMLPLPVRIVKAAKHYP